MFYLQKETELKMRLKSLIDKQKIVFSRGAQGYGNITLASLRDALLQFQSDLAKLQVRKTCRFLLLRNSWK